MGVIIWLLHNSTFPLAKMVVELSKMDLYLYLLRYRDIYTSTPHFFCTFKFDLFDLRNPKIQIWQIPSSRIIPNQKWTRRAPKIPNQSWSWPWKCCRHTFGRGCLQVLRFGSHRFGSSAQIAQPTSNHLKTTWWSHGQHVSQIYIHTLTLSRTDKVLFNLRRSDMVDKSTEGTIVNTEAIFSHWHEAFCVRRIGRQDDRAITTMEEAIRRHDHAKEEETFRIWLPKYNCDGPGC